MNADDCDMNESGRNGSPTALVVGARFALCISGGNLCCLSLSARSGEARPTGSPAKGSYVDDGH